MRRVPGGICTPGKGSPRSAALHCLRTANLTIQTMTAGFSHWLVVSTAALLRSLARRANCSPSVLTGIRRSLTIAVDVSICRKSVAGKNCSLFKGLIPHLPI